MRTRSLLILLTLLAVGGFAGYRFRHRAKPTRESLPTLVTRPGDPSDPGYSPPTVPTVPTVPV